MRKSLDFPRNNWHSEQGDQVRFIPLFRVEEEQYSVYLDLKNDSSGVQRLSMAELGGNDIQLPGP